MIESRQNHEYVNSNYDGSGASVAIPTLIINSQDGQSLHGLVRAGPSSPQNVILKADIEMTTEHS